MTETENALDKQNVCQQKQKQGERISTHRIWVLAAGRRRSASESDTAKKRDFNI